MNAPKVSVLLPNRNGEPYLREAIESVLRQSCQDWELLISENQSTDDSLKTIESIRDPRIKLFKQETSLSMCQNWDFLLQRASGNYWMLLGADDVLEPNHLQNRIALHQANPTWVISSGIYTEIDNTGRAIVVRDGSQMEFEPAYNAVRRLLQGNPMTILTIFCRTDIIQKNGLHFESKYPWMPDWHLWFNVLMRADGIGWSRQNTLRYRVHPTSATAKTPAAYWAFESTLLRVDILEQHKEKIYELGFNPAAEAKAITQHLWLSAQKLWRNRQFQQADKAWQLFRRYHGLLDFCGYAACFLWQHLSRSNKSP